MGAWSINGMAYERTRALETDQQENYETMQIIKL